VHAGVSVSTPPDGGGAWDWWGVLQLTLSDELFRQLLAKYDADADGLIDYHHLSRMMLPECYSAAGEGEPLQPAEGTVEYYQMMQRLAPFGDATNTPHGTAGTRTPARDRGGTREGESGASVGEGTPGRGARGQQWPPNPNPNPREGESGASVGEGTPGWARGQQWPKPPAPTVSSRFVALGDIDRLLRDKLMGLSTTSARELRCAFQRFNPNGRGPMTYSQFRQGLRLFYVSAFLPLWDPCG
jgi:hypothetical protein